MKKMITTAVLGLMMAQTALANSSTIKIGSIDRQSKGRTYTIGLTSSEIEKVGFSSSSANAKGQIKIYSIDYFDGNEAVTLLKRNSFTSPFPSDMSFPLSYLNSYPLSTKNIDCAGPCLVVKAEAYKADDLMLNIEVTSTNGDIIGASSILGLPSRSKSTRRGGTTSAGATHRISTGTYVLTFEKAGVNPDGSRNYKNFRVYIGTRTYRLDNEDGLQNALCKAIGNKLGVSHNYALEASDTSSDYRTVFVTGLGTSVNDLDENDKALQRITCR